MTSPKTSHVTSKVSAKATLYLEVISPFLSRCFYYDDGEHSRFWSLQVAPGRLFGSLEIITLTLVLRLTFTNFSTCYKTLRERLP
jgi:hypothetical protein